MQIRAATTQPAPPELYRFLDAALTWLRWAALAALLLLSIAKPMGTLLALTNWELVLLYAGYSLLVSLLARFMSPARALLARAMFDLGASALTYYLSADPGGPFFVLLLLAVTCGTVGVTLRGGLICTVVAAVLTALAEPLMPGWPATAASMSQLGARIVVLGLTGAGLAILRRRLVLEQETARVVRAEATRLEEIDRARAEFLSTISHNLRTPFTASRAGLGMLDTSLADRLRPDEAHLIGTTRRNVERLGILIDDLLAFNQIEAGALRLDRQPLDLRIPATNAVSLIHPLIAEKRQRLVVDLPEPLPANGDPRRLEQALVNLIDNAHRHTPAGTCIKLTGRAAAHEIELRVEDDGPGIPPEERETIFARFHRLASADGGSGLGLTIAEAIIRIHGGRIWVASAGERGAAFHVVLPRRERDS